ncbi:MAG: BrnT family toxin [Candidatus Sulfotelmatobacter sp.]
MRFEWDETKNRRNFLKHDVRFEIAALAFDDPYALTQRDESTGEEERWITLGSFGIGEVLFVVHTLRERGEDQAIRIISARRATPHERRKYEEAHQGTKTRHRRHPNNERRRH